jgi:hypothetical protein
MTCATHPDRESACFCRTCGKAMCQDCKREVNAVIYCEACLARELSASAAHATMPPPGAPNPGAAFGLGFIPGVGAIYNGQYAKAFVHVIIFGVLISIMDSRVSRGLEPLFGMMIPVFVFYMAFEARHTARKRLAGETVDEFSGLISGESPVGRSMGAVFLIGLGVIFLANNLGWFDLETIFKFWPLLLIGLGAAMLVQRVGGGSPREGS